MLFGIQLCDGGDDREVDNAYDISYTFYSGQRMVQ
jgi:hypothetical protein